MGASKAGELLTCPLYLSLEDFFAEIDPGKRLEVYLLDVPFIEVLQQFGLKDFLIGVLTLFRQRLLCLCGCNGAVWREPA